MGIYGVIPVTGTVGPKHSGDTYAVTDPFYGIDGLRNFSGDSSSLHNIPEKRRRAGMISSIVSGGTRDYYKLKDSPWSYNMSDWEYIPLYASIDEVLAQDNIIKSYEPTLSGQSMSFYSNGGSLKWNVFAESDSAMYISGASLGAVLFDGSKLYITGNSVNEAVAMLSDVTGSTEGSPITLTSPSPTWDLSRSLNASITLTNNTSLSITNVLSGDKGHLTVTQDGIGNHSLTLPANSVTPNKGGGVINVSTGSNETDLLEFYYNGSNYMWKISQDYS